MHGFDVLVVVRQGLRLGFAERFLEFGGEFVLTHKGLPRRVPAEDLEDL